MFNNLYSFSKDSNHVKFFKWIWNVDPTQKFKSMCPYFWSYVITILILPILLLTKLFGKYGSKFRTWLYNYNQKQKEKRIESLSLKWSKITDSYIAWKISNSKCWKTFKYDIMNEDYDAYSNITSLSYSYEPIFENEKSLRKIKIKAQKESLKENKALQIISIILVVCVLVVILYFLGLFFNWVYISVNWIEVFKAIGIILIFLTIIVGLTFLVIKIQEPISDWLKCRKCYLCKWKIWSYIGNGFVNFIKFFILVGDIIYNIYQKNCPLITWEDKK